MKLYLLIAGIACVVLAIYAAYLDTKIKKFAPGREVILRFNFDNHEYLQYKDSIIHCASCTNEIHLIPFIKHDLN